MPDLSLSNLRVGADDAAGARVTVIYAKNSPLYAVYRTDDRVLIQFADDGDKANAQRAAMAQLNPLRGEINGLIDGWKKSQQEHVKAKAARYDRRTADALGMACEGDVADAGVLLTEIKQDLFDARTSLARLSYLIWASAGVFVSVVVAWLFARSPLSAALCGAGAISGAVWIGAASGSVGAFFSIAVGMQNRTILTDLHKLENACDAIIRLVIGFIAAAILICLLGSGLVHLVLGSIPIDLSSPPPAGTAAWWMKVLVVGFLAGFSERLVPDLLGKMAAAAITPASSASEKVAIQGAKPGLAPPPPPPPAPPPPIGNNSALDACLCSAPVRDDEITPDAALPSASGGVAPG